MLKATVADESGSIAAVWFNQDWLAEKLRPGARVRLRGQLRRNEFAVRSYDLNGAAATGDLAPDLPGGRGDHPAAHARSRRPGPRARPRRARPASGRAPAGPDAAAARRRPLRAPPAAHARGGGDRPPAARVRRAAPAPARARPPEPTSAKRRSRPPWASRASSLARYRGVLPFELTPHQEQAIEELDRDLAGEVPMQRLLQGDVGSGKTVVALYALLRAVEEGYQGALDGADRDARRAALPDPRGALPRSRRQRRAAHELGRQAGSATRRAERRSWSARMR